MGLITILIVLWLLKKWFTRPIPMEGLTLIFANKGTGKTTYLAYLAQRALKEIKRYEKMVSKGYPKLLLRLFKPTYQQVLSTSPIHNTKNLDVKEHYGKVNIMNSLVLDDESHENFSNKYTLPPHVVRYLRYQRHFKDEHKDRNDMVLISHSYEDLNINCRRVYDNMYIMTKARFLSFITRKHITKIRRIKKYIDIDEVTHKPTDFYEFVFPLWGTYYFNRKPYYKYFDSLWRYELPEHQFEEWDTDCTIKEPGIIRIYKRMFGLKEKPEHISQLIEEE